jgi:hypothetical protein
LSEQEQSVKTTENDQRSLLDNIFAKITDQLKDLSYVEVITAKGSPDVKIDSGKENVLEALNTVEILARTKIELDGDIITVLPITKVNGEDKINQEIMKVHKENVEVAVQNWKSFMDTILNAVSLIADLAGMGKTDIRARLELSPTAPRDNGE